MLTQLTKNLAQGLLDLLSAVPTLAGWLYALFTAESNASAARPAYNDFVSYLETKGLHQTFEAALVGIADIKASAPEIISNDMSSQVAIHSEDFLQYVNLKAAAPDYPLDSFSIDFAMFGKSSSLFFMFLSAVLLIWTAGAFYRPIWRVTYQSINKFTSTLGKLASWFGLLMVLMQVMIIFLQQVFRSNGFPLSLFGIELISDASSRSMPWFATELMFFNAIVISFACAFTFVEGGHVRVDLIYSQLSNKAKAAMDLFGTLCFLLPSMLALWWLSWHLAINKIMTVTNFNHLTEVMISRDVEGRIAGAAGFKGWNWTVSTGESFTGVPLYFFLILVLASLMILQGVSFLLQSTDRLVSNETSEPSSIEDAQAPL